MKARGRFMLLIMLVIAAALSFVSYQGIGEGKILSAGNIKQGLDLSGGVYIVYEADKEDVTAEEMQAAVSLIQGRMDWNGWTEAEVAQEGTNRIRVDIPGVENAEEAIREIGQTAQLSFVDETGKVLLTGDMVADATKQVGAIQKGGNAQPYVALKFNDEGKQLFAEATAANIGKPIYIVMDGEVISAPMVQSAITTGEASITGNFTGESAEELASLIRAGSLPFNLNVIQMKNVGARLGADALATGVKAGAIGLALVLIFMLVVYKVLGFAADLALIIYVGLELILLNAFNITLTLPGIAGIILSVGMAVDANVVIFERLKEELVQGKTLRVAIKNGFSRALPAILDGNVTTLIAAVVLFFLGSGTVKGFATTLIMGIIISMFTALVVTRLIVNGLMQGGCSNPKYYGMRSKEAEQMKIVENRKKFFAASLIVIIIGFAAMIFNAQAGRGAFQYDVEFTGGTSFDLDLGQEYKQEDLQKIITDVTGQDSPQIQQVIGTNEVTVKIQSIDSATRETLTNAILEAYPNAVMGEVNDVSGTVSHEMQTAAIKATLIAAVAMLLYISLRFHDFRAGGSAIIALLHDVLIVLTAYAVFRIPVNNTFIVVLLTILGYSINATIVIFDRIRENKSAFHANQTAEKINKSISQTLARSINTSLTTFFTVGAIYVLGVPALKEFALPMMIGILAGAYSSVCISGSVWYVLLPQHEK